MSAPALQLQGLSKGFKGVQAVKDLSFDVHPGRISAFLGANGAGKTTTLRAIVGLTRPDSGSALVTGVPFRDLASPARTLGAVLDIACAHPGMTARNHLRSYCAMAGLKASRVQEALSATGVDAFADRRTGEFSTGMKQRLSLATALLGHPRILLLDEPTNGLDPAGIAWLRTFLRHFADDGGAVLVSSHALQEVALTADDVIVIDQGVKRWSGTVHELQSSARDMESAFLHLTTPGAASWSS